MKPIHFSILLLYLLLPSTMLQAQSDAVMNAVAKGIEQEFSKKGYSLSDHIILPVSEFNMGYNTIFFPGNYYVVCLSDDLSRKASIQMEAKAEFDQAEINKLFKQFKIGAAPDDLKMVTQEAAAIKMKKEEALMTAKELVVHNAAKKGFSLADEQTYKTKDFPDKIEVSLHGGNTYQLALFNDANGSVQLLGTPDEKYNLLARMTEGLEELQAFETKAELSVSIQKIDLRALVHSPFYTLESKIKIDDPNVQSNTSLMIKETETLSPSSSSGLKYMNGKIAVDKWMEALVRESHGDGHLFKTFDAMHEDWQQQFSQYKATSTAEKIIKGLEGGVNHHGFTKDDLLVLDHIIDNKVVTRYYFKIKKCSDYGRIVPKHEIKDGKLHITPWQKAVVPNN